MYNICISWWYLDIIHEFKNRSRIYLDERGHFDSFCSIYVATFSIRVVLLLTDFLNSNEWELKEDISKQ